MTTRSQTGPLAAILMMAACSSGCLSSFLGADRPEPDARILVGSVPELGSGTAFVDAYPDTPDAGFWTGLRDELNRISGALAHRPQSNPLVDGAAACVHADFAPVILDGEGGVLSEEEALCVLSRRGRQEMIRIVRKAFSTVLRRQPLYGEIRSALRVAVGGVPITALEPGPLLEDPAVDHSYGASRLFHGLPDRALFETPDVADVDSLYSGGVHPKIGLRWMGLYRFSWEPRDDVLVHRLEYNIGPVGVGAAYRIREGRALEAGLGMQLPLGPRSVITLSAGRSLHGADAETGGEPGSQRVMAALDWRF